MEQNRLHSPVLWGTIIAAILSILIAMDLITPTQSDLINKAFAAVLQALAAFGIANNPTNKTGF